MKKEELPYVGGLTITTDASFCPVTKCAGWAGRAVSNHFNVKIGGALKGKISDPREAEIKSLGNTLAYLMRAKAFTRFSFIRVNIDSLPAIKKLSENGDSLSSQVTSMLVKYAELTECTDVKFNHVKAHVSNDRSRRGIIHTWCDREARKYMRAKRKQIEKVEKSKIITDFVEAVLPKESNKPCTECPWTKKDMPDISDELKNVAITGGWFCCHVNMGSCSGAINYGKANERKLLVADTKQLTYIKE